MRILFYSLAFSFFLIALSLGIGAYQRVIALADVSSGQGAVSAAPNGIAFPIAELGNCTSRDDCRAYCDQTEHIDACVAFAKAHGLTTSDEGAKAQKFAQILQAGGGPGGCTSPQTCQVFCSNIQNISTCVAFAKQNGFSDDNLSRAEKIQQYLQSGGTMPGGCTSKDACESYCSDFSHADECMAFAQKVGIEEIENIDQQKIPSEQFQKFLELVRERKTPGQCTDAQSCQAYCQNQNHEDECLMFAKDAGFLSSDQADKLKGLGGKGPGGCDSEDSCKTYCNQDAHQQECLQFAQMHGLISQDEAQSSQNALIRLREGIDDAPDSVQQCLSSTLGQQTLQSIEAGTLIPNSNVGEQVSACFQNFGENDNASDSIKSLNDDVAACVKQKVGDVLQQIQQGKAEPTPNVADAVHACSQIQELNNEKERTPQALQQMLQRAMQSAPAEVRTCLQGHQQDLALQNDATKMQETMRQCFEQLKPEMPILPEKEINDIHNEQNGSEENQNSATPENMQQMMNQVMPKSEDSMPNPTP